MRRAWSVVLLVAAAGCGPRGPGGEAAEQAPPAAAVARLTGVPLHEGLTLLEREIVAALRDRLEGPGLDAFQRAEAVSDRLLETRFPFEWLRDDSYSVQARVRQIQSLADRVEASVRAGAPRDSSVADLRRLREEVLELRQQLAEGGSGRPTPLERLLAGRDTQNLVAAEGATGE
jgi:hypothetical protein